VWSIHWPMPLSGEFGWNCLWLTVVGQSRSQYTSDEAAWR
jgi:hypothetical protein